MSVQLKITWAQGCEITAELRQTLSPMDRGRMETMGGVGRGYAWGRQDSRGYRAPEHGGDALDFGIAYMIHVSTGNESFLSVRTAYEQWYETGGIL